MSILIEDTLSIWSLCNQECPHHQRKGVHWLVMTYNFLPLYLHCYQGDCDKVVCWQVVQIENCMPLDTSVSISL